MRNLKSFLMLLLTFMQASVQTRKKTVLAAFALAVFGSVLFAQNSSCSPNQISRFGGAQYEQQEQLCSGYMSDYYCWGAQCAGYGSFAGQSWWNYNCFYYQIADDPSLVSYSLCGGPSFS